MMIHKVSYTVGAVVRCRGGAWRLKCKTRSGLRHVTYGGDEADSYRDGGGENGKTERHDGRPGCLTGLEESARWCEAEVGQDRKRGCRGPKKRHEAPRASARAFRGAHGGTRLRGLPVQCFVRFTF